MATQEQIRDMREKILAKIKEHRRALDAAKVTLQVLQDDCTHPNKRKGSDYKDTFWYCPDCGKENV